MNPDESFGRDGLNPYLDVEELVDDIGLTEDEIAQRKSFVGFDREDERRLADLEDLLRENQTAIADEFYENLLQYEGAREVIGRSPKGVEALKETQRAYLVSLASGSYDRSYFENRARIGKLHEMLDMPLKYYVGQYGVYYDLLLTRLNDRVQDQVVDAIEEWAAEREAERDDGGLDRLAGAIGLGGDDGDDEDGLDDSFEETVRGAIDDGMMDVLALLRIINLDLQIATDTYVDSYAQRLEDAIERRERLAREVEADVQEPIDELHETSEVVARRAEAISTHTADQAASVDRAAGEISEVSAAIQEVASVSQEVREQSERTEDVAADGVAAADDALDELEGIEQAVDEVSTAVSSLEQRLEEIDEVVERLDDLAGRTSLLSKNAKIEASRAGESDADGALEVIATEVGSFAEQTQQDLTAIESIVEGIESDVGETIETAEETAERVDAGAERIRTMADSLEEIHDAARSTAVGMDDVAAATDQQAHSVESIADSVDDLSAAADQVATAAESVAAASQEQTASLRQVRENVERLTTDDGADRTPVYERVQ